MSRNCLILFCRYPAPGQSKTRLIPTLGADGAAQLQKELVEHSMQTFSPHHLQDLSALMLCYTGCDELRMRKWLEPQNAKLTLLMQSAGDFGERLQYAFSQAFTQGYEKVVLMGTDAPKLQIDHIQKALSALDQHDLVLGPATDGGYTLIGLKQVYPQLFSQIPWGTNQVLSSTLKKAAAITLQTHLLETLADIDRAQDLILWQPKISVIIPTLNEAQHILPTLARVKSACNIECLVVDGGSTDATSELVKETGFKVIASLPGRAQQMNKGAELSNGDYLLFLHADTLLPNNFELTIRTILAKPNVVAGAFAFDFNESEQKSLTLKTLVQLVNIRSRLLQFPYGDQALFMSRQVFNLLGGFPAQPIMEDFEMVRRLRKLGRITIAPTPVQTSPRRYQKMGTIRTIIRHQKIIYAYLRGISAEKIAQNYFH